VLCTRATLEQLPERARRPRSRQRHSHWHSRTMRSFDSRHWRSATRHPLLDASQTASACSQRFCERDVGRGYLRCQDVGGLGQRTRRTTCLRTIRSQSNARLSHRIAIADGLLAEPGTEQLRAFLGAHPSPQDGIGAVSRAGALIHWMHSSSRACWPPRRGAACGSIHPEGSSLSNDDR